MEKMLLKRLIALQVLDSRGNPTVFVEARAGEMEEFCGRSFVPSGASTGTFEAFELRDNDEKMYNGKSVLKAVENINTYINNKLVGVNIYEQSKIDNMLINLDGTPSKRNLGANAILGVSLAIANLAANTLNMPLYKYIGGINANTLPIPMMNILNGGRHSNNNLSIQEFMIVPNISNEFSDNLRAGAEIYHSLKNVLKENGYYIGIGDEGGFAPNLKNEEEAIEIILKSIEKVGYFAGKEVSIALDVAATEMYDEAKKINEEGKYYFWKSEKIKTKEEFLQYYINLVNKYPISSIEDPFAEEDWEMFTVLTEKVGNKVKIVGDDLFVTNLERLEKGIQRKAANSILIKPNQIGTLTETLETIKKAKANNFETIISHRSGETEDITIADIAVATGCQKIKSGAPCRTDRVAKYNRLLYIDNVIKKFF